MHWDLHLHFRFNFGLGHTWPYDLATLMGTPCLQAMRLRHGLRFRAMAVGLRLAGQEKIAGMIISSWKVGTSDQRIISPWQRSHPQWGALCVCLQSAEVRVLMCQHCTGWLS